MMEAGKLNRSVTFERLVETVTSSGAISKVWQPLLTARAEVRELRAEEVALGYGAAERETLVFVVRWHPTPVSTEDRVRVDGRTYDVRQIVEIGRRGGWKLIAVAQ